MSVLVALILIKDTSTDPVQAVIHSDVLYTVLYYAIFIKGERRLFFDCSFPSERPPGSLLTSRRLALHMSEHVLLMEAPKIKTAPFLGPEAPFNAPCSIFASSQHGRFFVTRGTFSGDANANKRDLPPLYAVFPHPLPLPSSASLPLQASLDHLLAFL